MSRLPASNAVSLDQRLRDVDVVGCGGTARTAGIAFVAPRYVGCAGTALIAGVAFAGAATANEVTAREATPSDPITIALNSVLILTPLCGWKLNRCFAPLCEFLAQLIRLSKNLPIKLNHTPINGLLHRSQPRPPGL
jgi:hypothetical protein